MSKDELIGELADASIDVEEVAGTLNLKCGSGPHAHRANLDIEDTLAVCETRVATLAFVEGVEEIIRESPRSIAHRWGFAQSAATLMPNLKYKTYLDGAESVAGSPPLSLPIVDDIVMTFTVRTPNGLHVVTQSQVDVWGVAVERIRAAARSMLFHYTATAPRETVASDVFRVAAGDGHDPARFIVLEDLDWDLADELAVAFPDGDGLYVAPVARVDILKETVGDAFERARRPVSPDVFLLSNQTLSAL